MFFTRDIYLFKIIFTLIFCITYLGFKFLNLLDKLNLSSNFDSFSDIFIINNALLRHFPEKEFSECLIGLLKKCYWLRIRWIINTFNVYCQIF